MGKANCPFCKSRDTFNIAYEYLGKKKTKNFTIISNHHLQNKNLSLKAKGHLSYMLSLLTAWDYSLAGLVANSKESKTSIRNTLN